MPTDDRRGWLALAPVGLSLAGVLVSGYLTWLHLSGSTALCTGVGGCEVVQTSRYAWVGPVPVAALGLAAYLGLLALSFWQWRGAPSWVALALFGGALGGSLYSAYLTWVEVAVLGAICPWCVASAVIIMALTGITGRQVGIW